MIKLILKKSKTEEDKKFIKEQFGDLGKMGTIVLIGALSLGKLLLFMTKKNEIRFILFCYERNKRQVKFIY